MFDATLFVAVLDGVRLTRGLTWKEVARESGVSASTVSRLIKMKRAPSLDNYFQLLEWARLDTLHSGQGLPAISRAIYSDESLTPRQAEAIDAIVKTVYFGVRRAIQ